MLIAEELLLLIHDDEKGNVNVWVDSLEFRLAEMLLLELEHLQMVWLTKSHVSPTGQVVKKGCVVGKKSEPLTHQELDLALDTTLAQALKPVQLVPALSIGLYSRLLLGLVEQGIVRREDKRLSTCWPIIDRGSKAATRARLQAVLLNGAAPTFADTALLAIAQDSGLVRSLVQKNQRKQAKARAKEVALKNWITEATKKALKAERDRNDDGGGDGLLDILSAIRKHAEPHQGRYKELSRAANKENLKRTRQQ
ncbi:MAG: GPP34 family phosphoprotein [Coriobacteriia bacterium]|nr:GPP34 family phosphoprotein [Coriobacteriia bacterium]